MDGGQPGELQGGGRAAPSDIRTPVPLYHTLNKDFPPRAPTEEEKEAIKRGVEGADARARRAVALLILEDYRVGERGRLPLEPSSLPYGITQTLHGCAIRLEHLPTRLLWILHKFIHLSGAGPSRPDPIHRAHRVGGLPG